MPTEGPFDYFALSVGVAAGVVIGMMLSKLLFAPKAVVNHGFEKNKEKAPRRPFGMRRARRTSVDLSCGSIVCRSLMRFHRLSISCGSIRCVSIRRLVPQPFLPCVMVSGRECTVGALGGSHRLVPQPLLPCFMVSEREWTAGPPRWQVVHKCPIPEIEDLCSKNGKPLAAFCRCWKSKTMPYCDGSHVAHNKVRI